MKLSMLLTIIATSSALSVNAQQFAMKTIRPLIGEIAVLEAKEGGKVFSYGANIRFSVSKGYFPGADQYNLDNPLTWFRTVPFKIQVQYYYSLPDSIIRLTEYTLNNSDTVLLNKVYTNNSQQLTKEIGKAVSDMK